MKIKDRKRFSLIELLCVIAIAAILMAIVVPAFFNMVKGQSVEFAAREIGSKLKAVRTYAISQRQYTALVFITTQSVTSVRYPYKSYRTAIVNSSNSLVSWVPDEKWDFLPTGTIVQDITTDSSGFVDGNFTGANTVDTSLNPDAAVFTSAGQNLKGISFRPTGDLNGGNTKFIRIGEGTNPTVVPGGRQNIANYAIIRVDQYTGRISYGTQ